MRILLQSVTMLGVYLVFTAPVYAQSKGSCGEDKLIPDPLCGLTLWEFLDKLIDIMILIATPIVVLMIIFAGFKFLTAQGRPNELIVARKVIMWTLIGALILFGAKAISTAIKGTVEEIETTGSI